MGGLNPESRIGERFRKMPAVPGTDRISPGHPRKPHGDRDHLRIPAVLVMIMLLCRELVNRPDRPGRRKPVFRRKIRRDLQVRVQVKAQMRPARRRGRPVTAADLTIPEESVPPQESL